MPHVHRLAVSIGLLLFGAHSGKADDQTDARALLKKAITALGGEAKMAKHPAITWKAKGKITIENLEINFTVDGAMQGINKCKLDLEVSQMGRSQQLTIVINGKQGWLKANNRVQVAPKEVLSVLSPDLHSLHIVSHLPALTSKECKLSCLGEIKIDKHDAVGIKIVRKGFPDVDLFFDKKSMMPLKCQMLFKDSIGPQEVSHEFFFSGYKKTDGISHFTKIAFHRDGKKFFLAELSEFKPHEKLEAATFAKPQ